MSEEELDHLYEFYIELSKLAEDSDLTSTHSTQQRPITSVNYNIISRRNE